ncbi:MAG TPA: hypothetical protein ENH85_08835 [Candidatus Scalindua sp.]|nr:hypothetical protein [Candidatus Scalindua sp.]HDZ14115.1 hypothetical protein [Pricia sp.]
MQNKVLYAWCAGIIDGEGSIFLEKAKIRKQHRPSVTVANTDYRIILKLKEVLGGGILLTKRRDRPNHLPCWTWYSKGRSVASVLEKVTPFLVSKKEKAEVILPFAKTVGKKPIDDDYRSRLVGKFNKIIL